MLKVFSQAGEHAGQITMSRTVETTFRERKSGRKGKTESGECPDQVLLSLQQKFKRAGNETAVSKMTCNIPCQWIQQWDVLKADKDFQ